LKIYVVGGAIRDQLLGLKATDRDYVVVGSSPEQMHAMGFEPVGKDFPVFLHPKTKEEYALARTERKSGQGYKGFSFFTSPDVSLEQDLQRRDFTINAMAQEVDQHGNLIGPIIDPCGGQVDLEKRIFRHISEAFQEDPLRILRLARFLARFREFSVDSATKSLVCTMVQNRELQHLVPERIWQEFSRGLMASQPSRMLHFLLDIGAAPFFLPEHLSNNTVMTQVCQQIDSLAKGEIPLAERLAILLSELSIDKMEIWLEQNRVSSELRDFAKVYARIHLFLSGAAMLPEQLMQLFERTDLWRKPRRFLQALDLAARMGQQTRLLEQAVKKVQTVNPGQIAKNLAAKTGAEIAAAVYQERLKAIASVQ
jgi:tRNA nucleotidyltransferase (CCA-adding enzyme)